MKNSSIQDAARSTVSLALAALMLPSAAHAFSCPPRDNADFPVDVNCDDGSAIFCSYPGGADPDVFFCTYSNTTGALVSDHNKGLCPASAVDSGSESACPPATPTAAPTGVAPAPTLTPWGLVAALVLLMGVAMLHLGRRRQG